jgi:gamma-glutamyltranspeptidase
MGHPHEHRQFQAIGQIHHWTRRVSASFGLGGGAQILRAGGNAVDAAIATQAALGVVYPHMTGLGGDAFWLIYDADSQALRGLNGSGRAAAQATPEFYTQQGYRDIPQRGPLAALTVPGAVDSWARAHEQFGKLAWADLLQPAIALARNGYPATGSQVHWTRRDRPYLQPDATTPCPFLPHGELPQPGETLTNPDLAATLETLAQEGATSFYQGAIAAQITDFLASVGGLLTAADLAQHRSDWVEPLETTYRGYRVAQLPPNSQGFTVLQMLNLIEAFDLGAIGHGTADYYHLMVEATKLAFVDRDRWLTDPTFADIPLDELVSKAYSDRRRPRIPPRPREPWPGLRRGWRHRLHRHRGCGGQCRLHHSKPVFRLWLCRGGARNRVCLAKSRFLFLPRPQSHQCVSAPQTHLPYPDAGDGAACRRFPLPGAGDDGRRGATPNATRLADATARLRL